MDNNKNRMKDRPKSDAQLRKIKPKENAAVGVKSGRKASGRGKNGEY